MKVSITSSPPRLNVTNRRRLWRRLLVSCLALVLSASSAELLVRCLGTTDQDGQFSLFNVKVRPYRIRLYAIDQLLHEYEKRDDSYVIHDPQLGWKQRPGAVSDDGLYRANFNGFRDDRDYDLVPDPARLRIALFGDSYTHGSKVSFEDSWGEQLEQMLRDSGIAADVLNFGAGGYGMDQAYLRWIHEGQQYAADLVIFGFRPPDAARNVNVFRCIYRPGTGVPFSKPRFILQDGKLELVNSPTISPEQILETLTDFESSELVKYEHFYHDRFKAKWWHRSRLASLAAEHLQGNLTRRVTKEYYDVRSESGRLVVEIIKAFSESVRLTGAEFLVVTLPTENDIEALAAGEPLIYAELLKLLEAQHLIAHSELKFAHDRIPSYFGGHYSRKGNEAVAKAAYEVAQRIIRNQVAPSTN